MLLSKTDFQKYFFEIAQNLRSFQKKGMVIVMAEIKGFKALRYDTLKAGDIKKLVCPPYDIISDAERENYLKNSEYNIIRLELPRGETPYEDAAKVLKNWIDDGILKTDDNDCIYIYEEEFSVKKEVKKIKGIICNVKLEEFSKGVVLPHEETLSKAKTDRFNLMSSTFCNFSQIYSLYLDETKETGKLIEASSKKPADIEFTTDDGIIQRLWIINDKDIVDKLSSSFVNRQLFIADGHHRYETALNFRNKLINDKVIKDSSHPANYVMMMLVDMDNEGLVVFPTHRLIKNISKFNEETVLQGINEYFEIEKRFDIDDIENVLSCAEGKSFVFYTGKDYYYLLNLVKEDAVKKLMPEKSDAYCNLDVTVLHTLILESLFDINKENMAKQSNLTYTRDLKEAVDAVRNGGYNCSFILNPTKVKEIKDVALANEKMPQKSTYFYPKLITGLVMNKLMDMPE